MWFRGWAHRQGRQIDQFKSEAGETIGTQQSLTHDPYQMNRATQQLLERLPLKYQPQLHLHGVDDALRQLGPIFRCIGDIGIEREFHEAGQRGRRRHAVAV